MASAIAQAAPRIFLTGPTGLCGLGDGSGSLKHGLGCVGLSHVTQDRGEVVQVGGDVGVVGSVGGFCDGEGSFEQGLGVGMRARLFRRVATVGWLGP